MSGTPLTESGEIPLTTILFKSGLEAWKAAAKSRGYPDAAIRQLTWFVALIAANYLAVVAQDILKGKGSSDYSLSSFAAFCGGICTIGWFIALFRFRSTMRKAGWTFQWWFVPMHQTTPATGVSDTAQNSTRSDGASDDAEAP